MLSKRKQTAIRLPKFLYDKLKKEAMQKGITVNALITIKLSQEKGD